MEYNSETLPYLEQLIPFLNQYGILEAQDARDIPIEDIKAISIRWGIKHPILASWGLVGAGGEIGKKPSISEFDNMLGAGGLTSKKKEDKGGDLKSLLIMLCSTGTFLLRNRGSKLQRRLLYSDEDETNEADDEIKEDAEKKYNRFRKMQIKNYFGLPPYSLQNSSDALVYLGRKPLLITKKKVEDDLESESSLEEYDGEGRRITRPPSPTSDLLLNVNASRSTLDNVGDKGEDVDPDTPNGTNYQKKKDDVNASATGVAFPDSVDQSNVAQKAVVKALFTMANNLGMRHHYVFKGGIDAVNRLINESSDEYVLNVCAKCIDTVLSSDRSICKPLVQEKGLLLVLGTLCEKCDPKTTKIIASRILWHCSCVRGIEDLLLANNIISLMQILVAPEDTIDEILAMVLISVINVSIGILGNDVENTVKFVMSLINRLNGSTRCYCIFYILENLSNMTRLQQFSSMLVDRSILSLLIHYLDTADAAHQNDQLLTYCIESFVNLSMLRKNSREIYTCGISKVRDGFFISENSFARSQALLMVGNLLNSGFFHDRISRDPIVRDLLYRLLDHTEEKQYLSVCFVISQLSNSSHSVPILLNCNVVARILKMFELTVDYGYTNAILPPALDNKDAVNAANAKCVVDGNFLLWGLLANLSCRKECLAPLFNDISNLVFELQRLVSKNQMFDTVVTLFYNLSLRPELKDYLSEDTLEMLVDALKRGLITNSTGGTTASRVSNYLYLCAVALANIAKNIPSSRIMILGDDLLNLVEEIGFEDYKLNIYLLSIFNSISNEENCCIRMIEMGVLKQLVSIHSTLYINNASSATGRGKDSSGRPAQSTPISEMNSSGTLLLNTMVTWATEPVDKGVKLDKEMAMALIAATFHNLMLKRATLVTGMLTVLLDLIKNDKSIRVLHTVRSLMCLSSHAKSKTVLGKNSQILQQLTALMRFGCEKTEQVQDYCAITIANILATSSVEKKIIDDIIIERPQREGKGDVNPNYGCVSDLLVIALLRINSIDTKVILAKAMFNLVCRTDIRMILMTKLEMLSAFIEICRNESIELLELSTRVVYNMSCDLVSNSGDLGGESTFANAKNTSPEHINQVSSLFHSLKIVHWIINRMTQSIVLNSNSSSDSSKSAVTSKPTRAIKILFGMTLANCSYNKVLLTTLANEKKTAEAMRIFSIVDSDEIIFCLAVTCLNMSRVPGCVILSETCLIQVINDVLVKTKNATIIQMLIASLCNFSSYRQFHDVLCELSLDTMIKYLSNASISAPIKLDIITYLYNLTTQHNKTRLMAAGSYHAIAGIWRFLKSQDDVTVMMKVARITRELCQMAIGSVDIYQSLLADGVMNILLRLAKLELVLVKLDISCCVYCLSSIDNVIESQKFVKYDVVDIIFWLLLHDCLAANSMIFKYISLTLRNLSLFKENCVLFVKEDRILSILKNLSKSYSDDTRTNIAITILNMLHVEFCRNILLSKGIFALIYDIANVQNMTVRQTCSSCLHLIQESIPDPDDPQVLPLLLCLLDNNDGQPADATERFVDYILPYVEGNISIKPLELPKVEMSPFYHESTNFTPTWITLITDVDNFFSPALIATNVNYGHPLSTEIRPLQSSASSSLKEFKKLDAVAVFDLLDFKDQKMDGHELDSVSVASSSIHLIQSSNTSLAGGKSHGSSSRDDKYAHSNPEGASLPVPELSAPAPPSVAKEGKPKKVTKYDLVMNRSHDTTTPQVSFSDGANESMTFDRNNSTTSIKSSSSTKLPKLSSKKIIPEDTVAAIHKTVQKQGQPRQLNVVTVNSQSVKTLN